MKTYILRNCLAIASALALMSVSGISLALDPLPQLPKAGFTPTTTPSNSDLLPPGTRKPPTQKPPAPPPPPHTQRGNSVDGRTPVNKNPVISHLSPNAGQPGDVITITGSGFGSSINGDPGGSYGEVYFIIGYKYKPSGQKENNELSVISGSTIEWSDTQIKVRIPPPYLGEMNSGPRGGYFGYDGQVYVVRRGARGAAGGEAYSEKVPFRYNPTIEIMKYSVPNQISEPWQTNGHVQPGYEVDNGRIKRTFGLIGGKGDDEFQLSQKLLNGWRVQGARIISQVTGHANATVAEFRQGSDSPYVKVHWWGDALSSVTYSVEMTVSGPSGLFSVSR